MMGEERFFSSLRPLVREIRLANGACIKSKGEGDVIFQPWIDGTYSIDTITFPNVLFAPAPTLPYKTFPSVKYMRLHQVFPSLELQLIVEDLHLHNVHVKNDVIKFHNALITGQC